MKFLYCLLFVFAIQAMLYAQEKDLALQQLHHSVKIVTDNWGVPHIYAQDEHDLFFAQGYQAAKDRLFQLEVFRRRATGTMAAVLGEQELKRDIGARLFSFRGNADADFAHYHPRGKAIIQAFTDGINAYINRVLQGKAPMPFELKALGISPGLWTPKVVISRHNGWLTNVQEELSNARLLQQLGENNLRLLNDYQPRQPDLHLDSGIDKERLNDDILDLYNAFRAPVSFTKNEIDPAFRNTVDEAKLTAAIKHEEPSNPTEGSNNWVINGGLAKNRYPMLANDPHRVISTPSLRYMVHLSAPDWDVIGGGEPTLPGVSIGHNQYGAWGLTIFETDAEDLYVYKLNPSNRDQYWYKGRWTNFTTVHDTIEVKNRLPVAVVHQFSVHGPVCFIDSLHHIAYAVKCGWLQKGCAPYLASLRMNQAKTWEEFRKACTYSYIPAENMIWADRKGHIGWQTVGIAPIRNHHSGMVPVPGDGRYEWNGYLPVIKRPSLTDVKEGFIATANENRSPAGYRWLNSIGYSWSDDYRVKRINEVLGSKKQISIEDMQSLQMDYYSMPARQLLPLLKKANSTDETVNKGKAILAEWDKVLSVVSVAASVYTTWVKFIEKELLLKLQLTNSNFNSTKKMIAILNDPATSWKNDAIAIRNKILTQALSDAMNELGDKLGSDTSKWQYGQQQMKHVLIKHPLNGLVNNKTPAGINLGPVPRGGDENTVNSTGATWNQAAGASFRVIIDCANWDLAVATNAPGQSGDPASSHYRDLFELWSGNKYFPMYYSRAKIKTVTESVLILKPETVKQ